jgi:hypothetical protein
MDELLPNDQYQELEKSVRHGLGPEASLIDVLTEGDQVRIFAESPIGKALITDCGQRCVGALETLTLEDGPSPEEERKALLALRLNIGILRRMAAFVAAGNTAERAILDRANAPSEALEFERYDDGDSTH